MHVQGRVGRYVLGESRKRHRRGAAQAKRSRRHRNARHQDAEAEDGVVSHTSTAETSSRRRAKEVGAAKTPDLQLRRGPKIEPRRVGRPRSPASEPYLSTEGTFQDSKEGKSGGRARLFFPPYYGRLIASALGFGADASVVADPCGPGRGLAMPVRRLGGAAGGGAHEPWRGGFRQRREIDSLRARGPRQGGVDELSELAASQRQASRGVLQHCAV
eukprot:scaffold1638_cov258-Pinguiococcus_pyrenoidosus.AAC.41